MNPTIQAREAAGHRKRFEASSETSHTDLASIPMRMQKAGLESSEKPWRERVGAAIARALQFAGLTQKEAWALLGHTNGAQLSRWISGLERPQFDALFAVDALRQPLIVAFAELAGAAVEIETVIKVRKTA